MLCNMCYKTRVETIVRLQTRTLSMFDQSSPMFSPTDYRLELFVYYEDIIPPALPVKTASATVHNNAEIVMMKTFARMA